MFLLSAGRYWGSGDGIFAFPVAASVSKAPVSLARDVLLFKKSGRLPSNAMDLPFPLSL